MKINSWVVSIIYLSFSLLTTQTALATIFKCTDKQGAVFYNDKPCPVTDEETKLHSVKDPVNGYIPKLNLEKKGKDSLNRFPNKQKDSFDQEDKGSHKNTQEHRINLVEKETKKNGMAKNQITKPKQVIKMDNSSGKATASNAPKSPDKMAKPSEKFYPKSLAKSVIPPGFIQ